MLKRIAVIVALAALSACANKISSDVTRFHQLPPPNGQAVAVVPIDKYKEGSIEFARFAEQVMQNLVRQGYARADGRPPAYIVQLDFHQRPVADDYDRGGSSMSIGVGGGSGGHHSGVGVGLGTTFDLSDSRGGTAMRTVTLWIDRVDSGNRVFEARVQSRGPARNFLSAVPYMIDAAFEDFPGQNGTTITVETNVDR